MNGFHIQPDELHTSARSLADLGDKLSQGGQKLEAAGQKLVSSAGNDRSGIGGAIAKAFGRGVEVSGKVFHEGGRVAGSSGTRLSANADNHVANDTHHAGVFTGIATRSEDPHARPSGGGGGSSGGGTKPAADSGAPTGPVTDKGFHLGRNDNRPGNPKDTAVPSGLRNCASDPVDVATGEVVLDQEDLAVVAPLPLLLERTHVSSYRAGHWFGPSWSSTVDQRLEFDDEGVLYFSPDGAILVFPRPAPDVAVWPVEGPRRRLELDEDGGYLLTDPVTGRSLSFGAPRGPLGSVAPLLAVTDLDGRRIDVDRDERGAPVGLRHSDGCHLALRVEDDRVVELRAVGQDADVVVLRYRYDDRRRLTEVVNSSGRAHRFDYDDDGRLTGWRDRNDTWYRYTYDDNGRCVRTEGTGGFFAGTFDYDRDRLVTTYTNSLGHATTYHLDADHRTVREVDPLDNTTEFEWGRYHLLARTDPLGRTTRFDYHSDGQLVGVRRPDGTRVRLYRSFGDPLTITVTEGDRTWRHEYDPAATPDPLREPIGVATPFAYDGARHPTALEPGADVLSGRSDPARAGTDGSDAPVVRDLFGRVSARRTPSGGLVRFGWTVDGQPSLRVGPLGTRERWRYDPEGNEVEHVDAAGRSTRGEYGPFDLRTATVDETGARTVHRYDTELRLVEVVNPLGQVWRYEYDAVGRLVREVDYDGRALRFEFDEAGQLVRSVNAADEATEYVHDLLGNVIERRTPTGTTTYAYDPVGRLAEATNADAVLVVERDGDGRIMAETVNGRTVSFDYDDAAGTVRRTTPSGVDSVWTYDRAGTPLRLATAGHVLAFDHDAAGREVRRAVDDTGPVLRQAFDAGDRLTDQLVTGSGDGGRVVQRRRYTYGPDGHLVAAQDVVAGPVRFGLDPAGRVTQVESADRDESYRYDPVGNVVDAEGSGPPAWRDAESGERRYVGNALSRAGSVSYAYDEQGRLIRRARKEADGTDTVWRFTWDGLDRLVGVATPAGQRWRYRYDPIGRRIAKQRMETGPDGRRDVVEEVAFTWDGGAIVEQDDDGHVITWDRHPADDRPVTQLDRPAGTSEAAFHAVVTDLVGTPTELVRPDGSLAWYGRATLWGRVLPSPANAADTPLRFPGQYHDAETGLHYNVYRYYDPATGRYTSHDPLGLGPAPNPVAYVPNPHAAVDPLGLAKRKCSPSGPGGSPGPVPTRPGSGSDAGSVGGSAKRPRLAPPPRSVRQGGGSGASATFTKDNYPPRYGSGPRKGENTDVEKLNDGRVITSHIGPQGTWNENKLSQPLVNHLEAHGLRGDEGWVKGHLLNDNLGGHGVSSNLTPLTQTANKNFHGQFESSAKDAVTRFHQLDNPYGIGGSKDPVTGQDNRIKLDFNVNVSQNKKFPNSPNGFERSIADHVEINTRYTGLTPDVIKKMQDRNQTLPDLPPMGTRMDTITGVFTKPDGTVWQKGKSYDLGSHQEP